MSDHWELSVQEHKLFLAGRDYILDALTSEMMNRTDQPFEVWSKKEIMAVAVAANEWAEAHGMARRVTTADVERVETRALGHSDYGSKLALYVAELLYKPAEEIQP